MCELWQHCQHFFCLHLALLSCYSANVPCRLLFFPCPHPTLDSKVHLSFPLCDLLPTRVANSTDSALFPLVSCSLDRKQAFRTYKCCAVFSHKLFHTPYLRCLLPSLIIGRSLRKEDEAVNSKRFGETVNPKGPQCPHNLLIQ